MLPSNSENFNSSTQLLQVDQQPNTCGLLYLQMIAPRPIANGGVVLALDPALHSTSESWREIPPLRAGIDLLRAKGHDEALQIIADSAQYASPEHDVYVCPYLFRAGGRQKGQAVVRPLVHADIDGPLDLNKVHDLGAAAVASGTVTEAGEPHGHVYVLLNQSVTPEQHSKLCHALAVHVGGDNADLSKISDNDVLRMPGTLNHKTDPPKLVTWLVPPVDPAMRVWSPKRLAKKLGVTLPPPPAPVSAEGEVVDDEPETAPAKARITPRTSALTVNGYMNKAVQGVLEELAALQTLPEGSRNQHGNGWDAETFAVACRLIELSNADPSNYPRSDARADFLAKCPTSRSFSTKAAEHKWESAETRVGDRPAEVPKGSRTHPRTSARDEEPSEQKAQTGPATYEELQARTQGGNILIDPDNVDEPIDLTRAKGTTTGADLDDLMPSATATPADSSSEGSSWNPINLEAIVDGIIDGTIEKTRPQILVRDDGKALFYRGKVNGIHGESGCGKTWTALFAAKQLIEQSENVVYVDLEDSPIDVIARLIELGAVPEEIKQQFVYVSPEESFKAEASAFLKIIALCQPALVVIDSTGEALSLEGANPNADEEIAAWFREMPKRIAALGPAVLLLDHMTKASSTDLWPIGSHRKRAAIDGAQYLQELTSPFSQDTAGAARLTCAKDRHGNYSIRQRVAVLNVDPGQGLTVTLTAPETGAGGPVSFKLTEYMERISELIADAPGPLSYRGIIDGVKGNNKHRRHATNLLIAEGYVEVSSGPRNGQMHTLKKPYKAGEEPWKHSAH